MRILLVNWMDPEHPHAGGAERHLVEVFGRLARHHDITLVSSGFPGAPVQATVAGIRVVRVGGRLSFAVQGPLAVRRLMATEPFDILIDDLNKLPLPLPRGRLPSLALVHHLWGRVAFGAAPFPLALVTVLAEYAIPRWYAGSRCIAVSASTRTELERRGIPPERIAVIENAVDPPPAAPEARSTVPLFVSIGRLQRYKRVHLLIEAAAVLEAEGHAFSVVIAGQGPERARLERLIRQRRLHHRIDVRGLVSEEEKESLLAAAWANVLMSRKEGWGLTVLEASRQGTCSVVAHAPGLWDAVRHLEDGLWIPYHHLRSVADGLRYLIRNPAAVERLGMAARERVRRRTWDIAAREMERVIRDELGCGRPPRAPP